MNHIELIAIDLDGTLLQSDNTIAKKDAFAIKSAIEKGIKIVVATGRVLEQVPDCIKKMPGIEYVLSSNGAKVTNIVSGQEIFSNCLMDDKAYEILEAIFSNDIFFEMYCDNRSFSMDYCAELMKTYNISKKFLGFHTQRINFLSNIKDVIKSFPNKTEKFYIIFKDFSHKNIILQKILRIENITVTQSSQCNIEINNQNITKAKGLDALCTRLDIKSQNIMAIGDSLNDAEMLKYSGFSVAMGSSPEELKIISNCIVCDNLNNGVAQAINKLL